MGGRLPRQHKAQRDGLALLTATMLDVRSANLMDLAASLPRAAERLDMRYQWISRLLGNRLIEVDAVMAPHGREVLARLAADGRTVVPMIDQTRATERHRVVTVAARAGERALPLGLAGQGGWGGDRLSRAARSPGSGKPLAAQGATARADGRPVLRQPRAGRPVPCAGLGLAAAAQAGPPGIRGRRRDHLGGVPRTGRAPA